jgi:hypothetical protein
MLRALIGNQPLTADFKSSWKFYTGYCEERAKVV